MADRIGIHVLPEPRYEAICALPLDVAFYFCRREDSKRMEEITVELVNRSVSWHVRMFTTFQHLQGVLREWTPDVLIAHWHSEEYLGWREEENQVSVLVRKLRAERGGDYVGKSPFLVGEYWGHDRRFMGDDGRERIGQMLSGLYDMLFNTLLLPEAIIPWNVAIGMWNMLQRSHGTGVVNVPFDPLFEGHLAGKTVREREHVEFDYKKQEARHKKRTDWLAQHTNRTENQAQQ